MEAEGAVDLELLGCELEEHRLIAAPVSLCDESAELALAAFEVAMLEGVERVFDALRHGEVLTVSRLIAVLQGHGRAWLGFPDRARLQADSAAMVRSTAPR